MDKRGKKIGNITRMFIVLSFFTLVLFAESSFAQINYELISCPDWFIMLNDFGYSDFMIQNFPGQVMHENLSGEWAAAIRYNGISTPGGVSMWLTPEFIFPDFTTNSTFWIVTPISTWDDPSNPTVGNDTGYSKISNGVVAIEINYKMHDTVTGTAVGLRPGGAGSIQPVMSNRYVLEITYTATNISNNPLTNVCFFQFLHANPNDDHGPNNYGVYDPTQYAVGAFQNYRYDIIQYGASIHNPPGSDITGFSSAEPPVTWGIGNFPGHDDGEPATGLHRNIYNDTLPLTTSGGPTEIAGAMKWCYGTLGIGGFFTKSVLLYNGYTSAEIPPPPRGKVDFDGDGKTDQAFYRPGTGVWFVLPSGGGSYYGTYFGAAASDILVPGDYDGDGKTDLAFYRPSTGVWFILPSGTGSWYAVYFGGGASDIPIFGDFDGDGKTDQAFYRPNTGVWFVLPSGGGSYYGTYFGAAASDILVPGDYDGDGKTDLAFYRPSTGVWFILPSGTGSWYAVYFGGGASDIPIFGDFDGDGKTDQAFYRPSTGVWFVLPSGTGSYYGTYFGAAASDILVPGDYDGDGKTDLAFYRPSNGVWFIKPSGGVPSWYAVYFGGGASDIPLTYNYY